MLIFPVCAKILNISRPHLFAAVHQF